MRSASCSKSTLQGLEAALVVTERAAGDRGERFCRIAAIKLTRLSRRRWTPSVPQLPQRVLIPRRLTGSGPSISSNNRLQFWCPESITACDPGTRTRPRRLNRPNHRRERLVTCHRIASVSRRAEAKNGRSERFWLSGAPPYIDGLPNACLVFGTGCGLTDVLCEEAARASRLRAGSGGMLGQKVIPNKNSAWFWLLEKPPLGSRKC